MERYTLISEIIAQVDTVINKAKSLQLSDTDFLTQMLVMEPAFEEIVDGAPSPKDYRTLVLRCVALAINTLTRTVH